MFATLHTSNKTFAYGYDLNGNVTLLVDTASGQAAATYDYGPFGELLRHSGKYAMLNPFRFSTKYTDDETSLLDYGLRYYDPATGRWRNRDPIGETGGVNLYGFIGNNGVNSIDFLGLKEILITVISGPDATDAGNTDSGFGNPRKTYGEIWGIAAGAKIPVANGAGPLGPTTAQLQMWLDDYKKGWESENQRKCCYKFKGNSLQSSQINPMTVERAKNLISKSTSDSDIVVLVAHGSQYAFTGKETGLYFYKGKVENRYMSLAYPVADLVSQEIKELKVLACYDAGLPKKAGGTVIVKVGLNIDDKNTISSMLGRFKNYVNSQCDACK